MRKILLAGFATMLLAGPALANGGVVVTGAASGASAGGSTYGYGAGTTATSNNTAGTTANTNRNGTTTTANATSNQTVKIGPWGGKASTTGGASSGSIGLYGGFGHR